MIINQIMSPLIVINYYLYQKLLNMSKYITGRRPFEFPKNIGDEFIDSAVCSTPSQKIRKVRSFTDCLYPNQSPSSTKVMTHSNELSSMPEATTGTKDSQQIKQKLNANNPFIQAKLQNLAKSPNKSSPVKVALIGETRNKVQDGDQFVRFREVRERPLNIGGKLSINGQY